MIYFVGGLVGLVLSAWLIERGYRIVGWSLAFVMMGVWAIGVIWAITFLL